MHGGNVDYMGTHSSTCLLVYMSWLMVLVSNSQELCYRVMYYYGDQGVWGKFNLLCYLVVVQS